MSNLSFQIGEVLVLKSEARSIISIWVQFRVRKCLVVETVRMADRPSLRNYGLMIAQNLVNWQSV